VRNTAPGPTRFDNRKFALLKRIAGEQIHVKCETVLVKLRDKAKGTALANPHDSDARFDGYREAVGYQVQITET